MDAWIKAEEVWSQATLPWPTAFWFVGLGEQGKDEGSKFCCVVQRTDDPETMYVGCFSKYFRNILERRVAGGRRTTFYPIKET